MKLKNSYCDKTQKTQMVTKIKTQIVTSLKNSNGEKKLKNLNCDKTPNMT